MTGKFTARFQKGIAIVLAMGVVAVAAVAATAIVANQSNWASQSELATDHAQARHTVLAGVDWARALLDDDRRTSRVDHLGEPWALRLPPTTVEGGKLSGRIDDQQGLFNLNNLVKSGESDVRQIASFRRLLSLLGLPATLADALADWLDADNELRSLNSAEDPYYMAQNPPYLAANQLLVDLADLALVRGFDDDTRNRLLPFVTALPRATVINVNTAPPEVLAAVIDGLELDQARTIVRQRERAYFRDLADFTSRLPRTVKLPAEGVAVSSTYFLVQARVTIGRSVASGAALLAREGSGWPVVLWRKVY